MTTVIGAKSSTSTGSSIPIVPFGKSIECMIACVQAVVLLTLFKLHACTHLPIHFVAFVKNLVCRG